MSTESSLQPTTAATTTAAETATTTAVAASTTVAVSNSCTGKGAGSRGIAREWKVLMPTGFLVFLVLVVSAMVLAVLAFVLNIQQKRCKATLDNVYQLEP